MIGVGGWKTDRRTWFSEGFAGRTQGSGTARGSAKRAGPPLRKGAADQDVLRDS